MRGGGGGRREEEAGGGFYGCGAGSVHIQSFKHMKYIHTATGEEGEPLRAPVGSPWEP